MTKRLAASLQDHRHLRGKRVLCEHDGRPLAMRGAPAKAIQELAGHRNLATTQRYMHLSPAAVEGAIRLLEQPAPVSRFGDILETVPESKDEAKG
jgi:integrase